MASGKNSPRVEVSTQTEGTVHNNGKHPAAKSDAYFICHTDTTDNTDCDQIRLKSTIQASVDNKNINNPFTDFNLYKI